MKVIAHRGASFEAKENSLEAVLKAKELAVHAIEIDVHLSKDHIPVVIHDPHFPSGKKVYETHSTDSNEDVVTLREILAIRGDVELMIELKEGDSPKEELALKTLEIVRNEKNILIGSFCPEILRVIHTHAPHIPLIAIIEEIDRFPHFLAIGITHFALYYAILGKIALPKGSHFWVWTIDDPETAKSILNAGATGIITNNPRLLLKNRD